jgi:hypothetical protein
MKFVTCFWACELQRFQTKKSLQVMSDIFRNLLSKCVKDTVFKSILSDIVINCLSSCRESIFDGMDEFKFYKK